MLEDLGCEVTTATGAIEALEKLSTDPRIEILITDINMPDMNGYALTRVAKEMLKELKVIVLSGRESDGRGFPLVRTEAVPTRRSQTNNGAAQAPAFQQVLASCVLKERVLEAILRIGRQALHQDEIGIGEPV